jgi:hypothetical protein
VKRHQENCSVHVIVIHIILLTMPTEPAQYTIPPTPHLKLNAYSLITPGLEKSRASCEVTENIMCTLCHGICPGADELQSSTMFRNTYQSGFLSILYSIG